MLVVPLSELVERLDADLLALGTLSVALFTVNVDPTDTTVLADLTVGQPSWCTAVVLTGYSAVAPVAGVPTATWSAVVFTNTGGTPVDVFGYYVSDETAGLLRWSERATGAPITVPAGGTFTVFTQYTRKNQP